MFNKYGYVYLTTDKINNKYYIGQHKSSKFQPTYKGSGLLIKEALKTFGKENFMVSLLCWCADQAELDKKEQFWIEFFNASKSDNFYNISLGGSGGRSFYYGDFSEAHRKHLGKSLKGREPWNKGHTVDTDERVKKHAYNFKGKHHTEENKRKFSIINLKENLSEETIQKRKKARELSILRKGKVFWINDGTIETIVNEDELQTKLANGENFVKGRLPDFIYMTNNTDTIKVHKSEIPTYINKGYYIGKATIIGNNISKSRRHWKWMYKDLEFETAAKLADYLRDNGYPKIANSTVVNIANGKVIEIYKELSSYVQRIPLEDANENKTHK